MGEVRGQAADELGLLGVHGVHLLGRGGRNVVGLVEDEQVEAALHRAGVEHLVEQPLRLLAAQPGQAHDAQRIDRERVGRAAVRTADLGAALGVDDREVEAELLGHLVLPLEREAYRAHDHHGPGAVAQQQFLGDEPGLDGLAEAHVVGEQQVDAGRVEGAGDRFELVVLDGHAGPVRRLQRLDVGAGDGRPADGVEERGQAFGRVESVGSHVGQRAAGQHAAAGLDLPDDLQRVAVPAVLDALQGHQRAALARLDLPDHPSLPAYRDQLADGRSFRRRARHPFTPRRRPLPACAVLRYTKTP